MATQIENAAQAGTSNKVTAYVNQQLDLARRQVKSTDLIGGFLTILVITLGFLLLAAIWDGWIIPLSETGRWCCLSILVASCLGYAVFQIAPLLLKKINPDYAARMIEQSQTGFKNSLLNYVALRRRSDEVNPAVFQGLTRQAAENLKTVPADATVDRSKLITLGFVLVGLTLFTVGYKFLSPKDPFQSFARVLIPSAKIGQPSRVSISDIQPGEVQVFFGDQVEISAAVRGQHLPTDVFLVISTEDGLLLNQRIPMEPESSPNRYRFLLGRDSAGLQHSLIYRIEALDGISPNFEITVQPNPTIAIETLTLFPPKYTKLPKQTQVGQGEINALEGTKIVAEAIANAPIKEAFLDLLQVIDESDDGLPKLRFGTVETIPMDVDGMKARASFWALLNKSREKSKASHYQFRFVSTNGDRNRNPNTYPIKVSPDLAPEIKILAPRDPEIEIAEDQTLAIDFEANDLDFEISEIRFNLNHQGTWLAKESLPSQPNQGQRVKGRHLLQPRQLGLKAGDTAMFFLTAADNRTVPADENQADPNITRSENFTLKIAKPSGKPQQLANQNGPDPSQKQPNKSREKGKDQTSETEDPSQNSEQQRDPSKDPSDPNQGKTDSDDPSEGQQNSAESESAQPQSSPDAKSSENQSQGSGSESGDSEASDSQGSDSQGSDSQGGDSQGGDSQEKEDSQSQKSDSQSQPSSSSQSSDSQNSSNSGNQGNSQSSGSNQRSSNSESMNSGAENQNDGQNDNQSNPSNSNNTGNSANQNSPSSNSSPASGSESPDSQPAGEGPETRDENLSEGERKPLDKNATQGEQMRRLEELLKESEPKEGQSSNDQQPDGQKSDGQKSDGQKSDGQKSDGQKSDGQKSDGQKSDGQKSEQKSDGQKSDGQKSDGQEPDGQKSDGQKSDGQESDGQKSDGQKSDGQESDGQKSDGQKSDGQKSDGQKSDGQKSDGQESDGQKSDGQKSDGQKSDGQKSDGQKSDGQEPDGQKSDGQESGGQESDGQKSDGPQSDGQESGGQKGDGQKSGGQPSSKTQKDGHASGGSQGADVEDGEAGSGKPDESSGGQNLSNKRGNSGSGGKGGAKTFDLERDKLNVDHAKKATDLILKKLNDQKYNPDPKLLEQMNWTQEDLNRFLGRWNEMKQAAEQGDLLAKRRYDQWLRSLDFRPNSEKRTVRQSKDDASGLSQDSAVIQPPPEFAPDFNATLRDLNRND